MPATLAFEGAEAENDVSEQELGQEHMGKDGVDSSRSFIPEVTCSSPPESSDSLVSSCIVYTASLPRFLYCPSFLWLYLQVADAELASSMGFKDHLSALGCPRTESEGKMILVTP